FFGVFGAYQEPEPDEVAASAPPHEGAPGSSPSSTETGEAGTLEVPVAMASAEERLATKSFDALEPDELAQLYRLMSRLELATPIPRLTRALRSRHPERAIERAAAAAPDWSSGTRIGDAMKAFIDRHGRRGMARGAVVVILSDGWERGDPSVVSREMERLSRL